MINVDIPRVLGRNQGVDRGMTTVGSEQCLIVINSADEATVASVAASGTVRWLKELGEETPRLASQCGHSAPDTHSE